MKKPTKTGMRKFYEREVGDQVEEILMLWRMYGLCNPQQMSGTAIELREVVREKMQYMARQILKVEKAAVKKQGGARIFAAAVLSYLSHECEEEEPAMQPPRKRRAR